jgi:hypothetical protein
LIELEAPQLESAADFAGDIGLRERQAALGGPLGSVIITAYARANASGTPSITAGW